MSLVACLVWTLFSGSLGGPVQMVGWPQGTDQVQTQHAEAAGPPFHRLPMFLNPPGPLVAREVFLPVPHKSPLPTGITSLLLPLTTPQQSVQGTGTGTRAVEVGCGDDQITVRVDRFQVRSWTNPHRFSLGSCRVSKVRPRYLYFYSKLNECGGKSKVVGGQLVYSFILRYAPPQRDFVVRVIPLALPIYCHYNRFHYSYKVGYRPQFQHTTFHKSLRSKLSFSLTVCNEHWEPLPAGQGFVLGEPVYFVARSGVLLAGERLYVDSCYATSSSDPHSQPRVDIITNSGCMTDSKREGSSSRFVSTEGAVLKFSVEALLFSDVSQLLYLHCTMSVSFITSHSSKSCNYNTTAGRWEELEASPSVCFCCDSMCTYGQGEIKNKVSSQSWFVEEKAKKKPRVKSISFQAEEAREREDQEDEEKKNSEWIERDFKRVRSFPAETDINSDEGKTEEAVPGKMAVLDERRNSSAVRHQEDKETEEEVKEEDNQLKELKADGVISSQQTEIVEKSWRKAAEVLDERMERRNSSAVRHQEDKETEEEVKEEDNQLKELQADGVVSSQQTEIVEKLWRKAAEVLDERMERRNSSAVRHQEDKETEEEVKKEDNQLKELKPDGVISSQQTEIVEKSSINVQRDSNFVFDSFDPSSPGSAGNVSTAEEGREREDQDEKKKKNSEWIERDFKRVRSFPAETDINSDEGKTEEAVPEKMAVLDERRNSSAVRHQEDKETEEEVKEEDNQLKELKADSVISSQQTEIVEKSSIKVQRPSHLVLDSFDPSSPGSAGNISTAAAALCTEGDHMNCSSADDGVKSNRSGSTSAAVGADIPSKDRATSDPSRSLALGSVWKSSVQESPLGSAPETLSELEQEVKSANKSFDTKSGQIPDPTDNSEDSKGPNGEDGMLQSLQIRGLEPDPLPAGCRDRKTRFLDDSGLGEGEALHHMAQFTEAAEPSVEEFPDGVPSLSSASVVGSEQMPQENLDHSSVVVTVSDSFHGAESGSMLDRKWAEAGSEWGLQS